MTRVFLSACILIMDASMGGGVGSAAMEGMTSISILSPHNGDTVGDTFDISYEILNGPKGNQAARIFGWRSTKRGFRGNLPTFQRVNTPSRSRLPILTTKTQARPPIASKSRSQSRPPRRNGRRPTQELWTTLRRCPIRAPCRSISNITGPQGYSDRAGSASGQPPISPAGPPQYASPCLMGSNAVPGGCS